MLVCMATARDQIIVECSLRVLFQHEISMLCFIVHLQGAVLKCIAVYCSLHAVEHICT